MKREYWIYLGVAVVVYFVWMAQTASAQATATGTNNPVTVG